MSYLLLDTFEEYLVSASSGITITLSDGEIGIYPRVSQIIFNVSTVPSDMEIMNAQAITNIAFSVVTDRFFPYAIQTFKFGSTYLSFVFEDTDLSFEFDEQIFTSFEIEKKT